MGWWCCSGLWWGGASPGGGEKHGAANPLRYTQYSILTALWRSSPAGHLGRLRLRPSSVPAAEQTKKEDAGECGRNLLRTRPIDRQRQSHPDGPPTLLSYSMSMRTASSWSRTATAAQAGSRVARPITEAPPVARRTWPDNALCTLSSWAERH